MDSTGCRLSPKFARSRWRELPAFVPRDRHESPGTPKAVTPPTLPWHETLRGFGHGVTRSSASIPIAHTKGTSIHATTPCAACAETVRNWCATGVQPVCKPSCKRLWQTAFLVALCRRDGAFAFDALEPDSATIGEAHRRPSSNLVRGSMPRFRRALNLSRGGCRAVPERFRKPESGCLRLLRAAGHRVSCVQNREGPSTGVTFCGALPRLTYR
jgi:hypothetical protein